jgi:hypothetical protein
VLSHLNIFIQKCILAEEINKQVQLFALYKKFLLLENTQTESEEMKNDIPR